MRGGCKSPSRLKERNNIMAITSPKDLKIPESKVEHLIHLIELDFVGDKTFKQDSQFGSYYRTVTVDGFYTPADINEVIRRYKAAGWMRIYVHRRYEERGQKASLTVFNFYAN
jgi:hypothetical protein